jgi:hypothetical protein
MILTVGIMGIIMGVIGLGLIQLIVFIQGMLMDFNRRDRL